MPQDFVTTLSGLNTVPKRVFDVFGFYLFFLTLRFKRHSFRTASVLSGLDESRFSAFLNRDDAVDMAKATLNRVQRRALKSAKKQCAKRLVIIIDTTFQQRRSQSLENIHRYHTGTRFVTAHKLINAVMLTKDEKVIPLATVPVYTKKYCEKYGKEYVSEYELSARWIESLADNKLFSEKQLETALFLLDAGFDTKRVQKAIIALKSNFVVAIKNTRSIDGKKVSEYFRRHTNLSWSTIRMKFGSGKKTRWRKFSVRTALKVKLKGVGLTNVVLSKAHGHARKSKYLVSSDLTLNTRQVIRWYAKRWVIELWHREMKQNFGYIDCHCRRFSAVEAHIQLSVTAYLLVFTQGHRQISLEQYLRKRDLTQLCQESSRFGGVKRLRKVIYTVIQSLDAWR